MRIRQRACEQRACFLDARLTERDHGRGAHVEVGVLESSLENRQHVAAHTLAPRSLGGISSILLVRTEKPICRSRDPRVGGQSFAKIEERGLIVLPPNFPTGRTGAAALASATSWSRRAGARRAAARAGSGRNARSDVGPTAPRRFALRRLGRPARGSAGPRESARVRVAVRILGDPAVCGLLSRRHVVGGRRRRRAADGVAVTTAVSRRLVDRRAGEERDREYERRPEPRGAADERCRLSRAHGEAPSLRFLR